MRAIADRVEFHLFHITGEPPEKSSVHFHRFKPAWGKLSVIFSRKKFLREVKKLHPDLCYVLDDGWQMEYMRYCADKLKIPLVIRLRGDYKKISEMKESIYSRLLRSQLRENCYNQASLIVPVSERVRQAALCFGHKNVSEVVPSGVDFDQFKPTPTPPHKFTVGYAGRLSLEKGINTLCQVASLMPGTYFMVAGRKQLLVEFPDNVDYLGRLSYHAMPWFMNLSDVVFLPSKTEGMPLTVLEAYACGKPVVMAREVFPEELPAYGAFPSKPGHFEYAEVLDKVRDLPQVDIRSQIKEYTWENFGEKMVKLMEGVASDG